MVTQRKTAFVKVQPRCAPKEGKLMKRLMSLLIVAGISIATVIPASAGTTIIIVNGK
jgi:hypothetical protein